MLVWLYPSLFCNWGRGINLKKKYLDLTGLSDFLNNLFNTFSTKNHVHNVATSSSDGFISSSDKSKLDGIVAITDAEIDDICV